MEATPFDIERRQQSSTREERRDKCRTIVCEQLNEMFNAAEGNLLLVHYQVRVMPKPRIISSFSGLLVQFVASPGEARAIGARNSQFYPRHALQWPDETKNICPTASGGTCARAMHCASGSNGEISSCCCGHDGRISF